MTWPPPSAPAARARLPLPALGAPPPPPLPLLRLPLAARVGVGEVPSRNALQAPEGLAPCATVRDAGGRGELPLLPPPLLLLREEAAAAAGEASKGLAPTERLGCGKTVGVVLANTPCETAKVGRGTGGTAGGLPEAGAAAAENPLALAHTESAGSAEASLVLAVSAAVEVVLALAPRVREAVGEAEGVLLAL